MTTLGIGVLVLGGLWMLLRAWRRGRDRPLVPAMAEAPFQLDASRIDPIDLTPEMRDLLALAASGDEDAMQEFAALQGPGAGSPALDHEIDIAQVLGRLKAPVLRPSGEVVKDQKPSAARVILQGGPSASWQTTG